MAVSALSIPELTELISNVVKEQLNNQQPARSPGGALQQQQARSPGGSPRHADTQESRYMRTNGYRTHQQHNGGYQSNGYHNTHQRNRTYNQNNSRSNTTEQQAMQQIRIMVTFVETACELWGQVLTPDMVDIHAQLESDLNMLCPKLEPVTHVARTAVYATLWDRTWSRCITCSTPDPEGKVEVLYVDFGNRARKSLSELVLLRNPRVTDVPYLACPFRFNGMVPVPEHANEAIARFNTTDVLTGVVTRKPIPSDYTSLVLIRPSSPDSDHHGVATYNNLMLELGYCKLSEVNRSLRAPSDYQNEAFTMRIRSLQDSLREKDTVITKLYKKVQESGGELEDMASLAHSLPRSMREGSLEPTVDVREKQKSKGQTTDCGTTMDDSDRFSVPTQHSEEPSTDLIDSHYSLQEDLDDLVCQLELYSQSLSLPNESVEIKEHFNILSSCSVDPDLDSLKTKVESTIESLNTSVSEIAACTGDKSVLKEAVAKRDTTLRLIVENVSSYLEKIQEAGLSRVVETADGILKSLDVTSATPTIDASPEELLSELDKMESAHNIEREELKVECNYALRLISEDFSMCSTFVASFETGFEGTGIKELELSGLEKERLSSIGNDIAETKSRLTRVSSTLSEQKAMRAGLLTSLRSVLASRARLISKSVAPYQSCCEEYRQQSQRAEEALANKPDMSALDAVKGQLKAAKRAVKLAEIEFDEDSSKILVAAMKKLHELYEREEAELSKLAGVACTSHPELLIEYPQLKHMQSPDHRLIKSSWQLNEFVLPDSTALINSAGHNVYPGFYSEKEIFLVQYSLQCIEESLEEQALRKISGSLIGCFAIIIDKRGNVAYGAIEVAPTEVPPI